MTCRDIKLAHKMLTNYNKKNDDNVELRVWLNDEGVYRYDVYRDELKYKRVYSLEKLKEFLQ